MTIKTIRQNNKLRLYKDEGYEEPYVLEWRTGKVYDTYKILRKALSEYKKISRLNGICFPPTTLR